MFADGNLGEPAEMLQPAGRILSFLNHYLPEDARVELLNAHLLRLGGEQPPYVSVPALSEMYHRPGAGVGCGSLICLMAAAVAAATVVLRVLF